tara:strand:- start:626 stop:1507 length:882 start_codon:yes stop_codon:yes gene_type:complete
MRFKLGIIGGSGLYNLPELKNLKFIDPIEGPFGKTSGEILKGEIDGIEVFFLARHGKNHSISPSNIPFRANIEALKRLGCNDILSISAVGSLKEELYPGRFLIVDQYIDRTFNRIKTFFDRGIVAHVSMADPVCRKTSKIAYESAVNAGIDIVYGGTYLVMEGPQFSSLAESNLYRSWNCDVIGMTNMPEAKLAREAEIRYVSVAMVTDYDCWRENEENVDVSNIIETMNQNAKKAQILIKSFISNLKLKRSESIIDGVDNVLDKAIITNNYNKEDLIKAGLDAVAGRIINVS